MYTIIPLLLAHIQELNNQISFLFNFIVKNIPLKFKEKDDSLFSPKYNKLKVDKIPVLNTPVKKKNFKLLYTYIIIFFLYVIFHSLNILKFNAKEIIYVSCDPMTLVRDLNILNENYNIEEITPFDMFPNTYHVECLTYLTKM